MPCPRGWRMAETSRELVQSAEVVLEEIEAKRRRLMDAMADAGIAAVHLHLTENITWLTAGRVDRRVLLPSALGIASILLRQDGEAFYLTPDNEARRLAEEDYAGLPFTAVTRPWHAPLSEQGVRRLASDGRVISDRERDGATLLSGLRATLRDSEIARYRWLGEQTAEVTSTVLRALRPGDTERAMAARVSAGLLERGIEPTVLLMAADDRILHYKHAVAQNRAVERFGMLNLCARRWGLCVSITRFVHFGPLPLELSDAFGVAADVNAALLAATRKGATAAELFATAAAAYTAHGHTGEEQRHHQGGATGYAEREWVATPAGTERVEDSQAFAWNPSITGGKVEDTVVLRNGQIERLTATPDLPVVSTKAGGVTYESAGVLIQ
jgi:Xaa-Pro dipeptidase